MEVTCYTTKSSPMTIHQVPELQTFLAWSYSIAALPTILLNLVVLLAIWKTPSLYKPKQALLANLALTDFLYGMTVMPLLVASNVLMLNHSRDFCQIWIIARALGHWLAGVCLYTLTVISIDRFLAVKLKISYRVVFTTRRCIMALSVGWLGGALLVGISYVVTLMAKYTVAVAMVILIFIILTSYGMAYHNLKKMTSIAVVPTNPSEGNSTSQTQFSSTRYKKSFHTMLLILAMTLVFYVPITVALGLERLVHKDWTEHMTRIGELILSLNSTCNPLLYLWCMKELRIAVKNILNV